MYIISREESKEIDRCAIEEFNFPSIILMENAANGVYEEIKSLSNSYLVICGTGNNGGDGLAIARKLIQDGKDILIAIVNPNENYSEDFKVNFNIITSLTDNIIFIKDSKSIEYINKYVDRYEVIIDSIFGVGLNRELDGFYKQLVNFINGTEKVVLSIDVPTGLDCNKGIALGEAIKATRTYTFEGLKLGFLNYSAFQYIGKVFVVPIGIPDLIKEKISEGVLALEVEDYKKRIIRRDLTGYKGNYGKCVIFAGSMGFSGAAGITTEACTKTGAGLTTLVTTKECQNILSSSLREAMTANNLESKKIDKLIKEADVIGFGPGLQQGKQSEDLLAYIIDNSTSKLIVDAEGINILGKRKDLLIKLQGRAILTPHLGEMARLVNKRIKEIEDNRIEITREFAKKYGCILLLKGYNTTISDGNKVYINRTGSSKMASGGMGDCLTGIVTSLVGQGHSLLDGALIGTYVHGEAGDVAGKDKYSVVATDVIEIIPKILNLLIVD